MIIRFAFIYMSIKFNYIQTNFLNVHLNSQIMKHIYFSHWRILINYKIAVITFDTDYKENVIFRA